MELIGIVENHLNCNFVTMSEGIDLDRTFCDAVWIDGEYFFEDRKEALRKRYSLITYNSDNVFEEIDIRKGYFNSYFTRGSQSILTNPLDNEMYKGERLINALHRVKHEYTHVIILTVCIEYGERDSYADIYDINSIDISKFPRNTSLNENYESYFLTDKEIIFNAPKLLSCTEICISDGSIFNAPELLRCSTIYISKGGILNAPKLKSIDNSIVLMENSILNAPDLKDTFLVKIIEGAVFNAPNSKSSYNDE
jgi:hypothetical protein